MSSFLNPTTLYLAGIAFGAWWLHGIIQERRDNPHNLPLPRGPKSYPIVGSLLDFPYHKPWLVYDEWFKIFGNCSPQLTLSLIVISIPGDMVYFRILGQGFPILGSLGRVYDLFERRSSNDRPRLMMMNEQFVIIFALVRFNGLSGKFFWDGLEL